MAGKSAEVEVQYTPRSELFHIPDIVPREGTFIHIIGAGTKRERKTITLKHASIRLYLLRDDGLALRGAIIRHRMYNNPNFPPEKSTIQTFYEKENDPIFVLSEWKLPRREHPVAIARYNSYQKVVEVSITNPYRMIGILVLPGDTIHLDIKANGKAQSLIVRDFSGWKTHWGVPSPHSSVAFSQEDPELRMNSTNPFLSWNIGNVPIGFTFLTPAGGLHLASSRASAA